eukprot:c22941_g1_i1 orf=1676-2086(-)
MRNLLRQVSPGINLRSNCSISSLHAYDRGFTSHIQSQPQLLQRDNFNSYSAAVGVVTEKAGRQYSNENVSTSKLYGFPVGRQIQYPDRMKMASFSQGQQQLQAAAAAHAQLLIEGERVQNRQHLRQQFILRQQQLQ